MIPFTIKINEQKQAFLARVDRRSMLSDGVQNKNGILVYAERDENNNIKGFVKGDHWRLYKLNDTEYAHYNSRFSRTNFKGKLYSDNNGSTYIKGFIYPHFPQFIAQGICLICVFLFFFVFHFSIGIIFNSVYAGAIFIGLGFWLLTDTILHIIFSYIKMKKFITNMQE